MQTLALSETSMSSFLEIYNQFIGSTVQHAIEFYSSHSLRVVHTWDMLTRVIHVFDPAGRTQGCTADQQERHELIVPRLHDGCFNDFYAGWPTPKKSWMTIFPRFLDTTVSREESGICALHIIRYHDGDEDKDTNNQEHPNENKEICSSRRPETSRQPVIPACRCNIASHRC